MPKNTKSQIQAAVDALNSAFKADESAIWTIMNAYTTCNETLADHPTVQVIEKEVEGQQKFTVGPLGILNGVLEAALDHRICIMTAEPDENGQRKLLGFDIYKAPEPEKSLIIS